MSTCFTSKNNTFDFNHPSTEQPYKPPSILVNSSPKTEVCFAENDPWPTLNDAPPPDVSPFKNSDPHVFYLKFV